MAMARAACGQSPTGDDDLRTVSFGTLLAQVLRELAHVRERPDSPNEVADRLRLRAVETAPGRALPELFRRLTPSRAWRRCR